MRKCKNQTDIPRPSNARRKKRWGLFAIVTGMAAMLAHPSPGGASESASIEATWVEAATPEGAATYTVPGILIVPAGWARGGDAAVVLAERPSPEAWRSRLVAALLDAGAAVLQLDPQAARGEAEDNDHVAAPLGPRDLLPDLFGALRGLTSEEIGAGAVVAFGQAGSAGGQAVLLATGDAETAAHLRLISAAEPLRFIAGTMVEDGCPALALSAVAQGGAWPTGLLPSALIAGGGCGEVQR